MKMQYGKAKLNETGGGEVANARGEVGRRTAGIGILDSPGSRCFLVGEEILIS